MISYIMQVAFTCFCGLLLPMIVFAINSYGWRKLNSLTQFPRRLQSPVNEINELFCISVMISGIVRYRQSPPILETMFIQDLLMMQALIITALPFSRYCDSSLNHIPCKASDLNYGVALAVAQISISFVLIANQSAFGVYHDVAKSCHNFRGYPDVNYLFPKSNEDGWKGFGIGFATVVAILFIVCFIYTIIRRIRDPILPAWLRKHFHQIFFVLLGIAYVSYVILSVTGLARTRRLTRQADNKYEDDEWGYGQTTAVLLWAPILRIAVKATWSKLDAQFCHIRADSWQKHGAKEVLWKQMQVPRLPRRLRLLRKHKSQTLRHHTVNLLRQRQPKLLRITTQIYRSISASASPSYRWN